jgi:hypothetical protein
MEIRRIREDEGEAVAALWQELARGVLTPARQARIARMLSATAWHRSLFTLVAVDEAGAIAGFQVARVDDGGGLLPGAVGWLEEGWPLRRDDLVEAALAELRTRDVWTVRVLAEEWDHPGFEAEVRMFARYE